jgi:hypothetical protein
MTNSEIIAAAADHVGDNPQFESSARLALSDAEALRALGRPHDARRRALDSLKYSVGVFSPVFERAVMS